MTINHPLIPNIMEQALSKDVQEKLDLINWDSLKEKDGMMTDLVYANKEARTCKDLLS